MDLPGLNPYGSQTDPLSNRYVTVVDTVVITSDSNSIELDNVAAAAPEASAWAMMIIGFFGLGYFAYWRKSLTPVAAKA